MKPDLKDFLRKLFIDETDSTFIQFFRYIFVGGAAFVADYGTMVLFKEALGCDALIAAAAGFIIGLAANYIISTFWIFRHSRVSNRLAEFAVFALIGIIGLGINEAIIWLFDDVLATAGVFGNLLSADKYYLIGKLVSTAIVFVWNFAARKLILYRK